MHEHRVRIRTETLCFAIQRSAVMALRKNTNVVKHQTCDADANE